MQIGFVSKVIVISNVKFVWKKKFSNLKISKKITFSLFLGFQIGNDDADAIFDDLDHDGDGRISFEDFSFGFRDFLTPGARRGSAQVLATASSPAPTKSRAPSFRYKDSRMDSLVEFEAKQHVMEQKHSRARHAWRHLADNLSKDDIKKFLGVR